MREFSVPATTPVADEENLTDMVWANAERFGTAVSFRRRIDGTWVDVTAREFADQVLAVAKGLVAAGVKPGERVALMARTRYEWTLIDFAVWAAGCATVPVYETSSPEQVEWILSDSGATAVIVETPAHRATVDGVRDRLPEVRHLWQIEGGDGPTAVEELTALGADLSDSEVHTRRRTVRADDLATIIYTSGTTGRPKGCELSHRNLLGEVRSDVAAFPQLMAPGSSLLMFLPLAHVLARAITICCVYARATVGHTPDIKNLATDLGTFRPNFVVAVPRVFEKVYNAAKQKAHSTGKGRIFDIAEETAVAYSEARDRGSVGLGLKLKHLLFDKLVYGKLRAALGGRCVAAVSGGAPLGDRLAHFFRGAGLTVFEGYGLTETSAAACVNTPQALRIGTVGRPIAGTAVRIAEDGEVLVKGEVVFRSYRNNEQATRDALEDGWFHTGDLGELDDEGFLRITGRKKEIIVTAGGKNVAPAVLEDRLRVHPLISQCMVVGDKQPFIGALITIDPEFFPAWKERHGKPAEAEVADLVDDPDLRAEIQAAVDEANKAVSHAESIKKFRILPVDFTETGGELTPSLKLRRNVVASTYAEDIAAIYAK
ncbi:long-chain acyl-CoA synthetase [Streptoalloteichus tenebrarius]|uniref:Acyl-CoA synthetase n=1 Tax=Streptoalloteichus tenebrarius (strain ATCC 17920 / DSM 40477 / JCM 4838 / CBS 697.72 / NBRC 16177 / NCIMB 11028 / NRRL B-12390 / A12253. 1 / ISP 5477) TaxID=1933 RepID=A0ABT1HMH4_STRSD|nr:AMP-dependent synthetase/ligase [Streptoalloteichus tenebrarius]MCP2256710.1 long-chain acyl-CoA synthetase [Streptoalloteichus tenebrarius]BFF00390.1 long-chain fatty acid--CoA ligase [Streptoalloteichus tenebrarius]